MAKVSDCALMESVINVDCVCDFYLIILYYVLSGLLPLDKRSPIKYPCGLDQFYLYFE